MSERRALVSRPSMVQPPPPKRWFTVLRMLVKAVALGVGGVTSFVGLMATAGLLSESGYIRVIFAVVLMLAVPAFTADRLLPDGNEASARGLTSDVFAIIWLGVALLFAAGLQNQMAGAFTTEAERLERAGYTTLARGARYLAAPTEFGSMATLPEGGRAE